MKIETLASGTCNVGVHRTTLTPAEAYAMAGYSWAGRIGTPSGDEDLFARALYLESAGECVALCFIDLMSASLRLVQAVAERLKKAGEATLAENFILSGTHTHTGPGNFYGNSFYDVFAQNLFGAERKGFQAGLVAQMADAICRSILGAKQNARSGRLVVNRAEVWGLSRNRSLPAYAANFFNGAGERITLGGTPPAELSEAECAIDPRLTTLTAVTDTQVIGAFSLFGCHATALGPKWETYARDWPGVLVDTVEAGLRERGLCGEGTAVAALGQGAGGDITPLPFDDDRGASQGPELAQRVGAALAKAALACVDQAMSEAALVPLVLSHESGIFRVDAPSGERPWMIGLPVMGGAEDGRSVFYELGFVREGTAQRPDGSPQSPKVPALGVIQEMLAEVALDIAPYHPWHRLKLGAHVIFSVPGEPTATAAHELETALLSATGHASASVLGYTGDYAGYFTTEAEYECQ
ncbi:MAG TPA: neutral/alkaline non-lysosomal ceramidase N-terminal domain-containing protein, partial [Polyangiaceae bacterium]|nr:neutral/alkaline non-lysosomal ceramidase N-terminal domain-containing protein [Polyangiaceae bacterium]